MIANIHSIRPGRIRGNRPEKLYRESPSVIERFLQRQVSSLTQRSSSLKSFSQELKAINSELTNLQSADSDSYASCIADLRTELTQSGLNSDLIGRMFALIAHHTKHLLGFSPHPEQYFAGWSMLHGALPEMKTGEGKTITIAFPAITMALTGTPVHIITVNEYLVERDARLLTPLYRMFGLSIGIVTQDMTEQNRRSAYAADIVYCTNKQVTFDYLRDQRNLGFAHSGLSFKLRTLVSTNSYDPVQRGLCFAILDEADSVLIDEAKVPLILTEPNQRSATSSVEQKVALGIARTLHEGVDYTVNDNNKIISLTENGQEATRSLAGLLEGTWRFERYRNELIKQALSSLHIYKIERDYIIRENQVVLVDQNTGRTMLDRKLQNGMHRMLEIKERCKPSDDLDTVATISYQRFFQKYYLLTGLSGTLREVKNELQHTYSLDVVIIPPHHRNQYLHIGTACYSDRTSQISQMLTIVQRRHSTGQPILIGTRSVELSNRISDVLSACDIKHELLNAVQDHNEANIVSKAGSPGAVTVATNMAGRGTDIPLSGNAVELGGLHVINMEFNESPRIDRQLFGRAARQGEPGSGQSIFSLTDDVLDHVSPRAKIILQPILAKFACRANSRGWAFLIRVIQWRFELSQKKLRNEAYAGYSNLKNHLAVSGDKE